MERIKSELEPVITDSYSSSLLNQKTYLLSLLAHDMTVYARDAYPSTSYTQGMANKLITFNEIQHTLTGQLRDMLAGDEKRYPDNIFISILFEKAEKGEVIEELAAAFKRAIDSVR